MVLEKTLESPLDCKEISRGCSLEGVMLKLKLQYFGHLMGGTDSSEKIVNIHCVPAFTHHIHELPNKAKRLLPRDGSKFLVCLAGHFTAFGSCLVHFRPERGAADRDVPNGNDQFSVQGHLRVELLHKLEKKRVSFIRHLSTESLLFFPT